MGRPALSGLDGKSLAEIYHLAAPGEDVPAALLEADARRGRLPGLGSGGAVPAAGGQGATGAPVLRAGPSLAPALQGTTEVRGAGKAPSDPFYQSQSEQTGFMANFCNPALACQTTGYPAVVVGNPSSFSVSGYTTREAPAARTLNIYHLIGGVFTIVSSNTIPPGVVVTVWDGDPAMTQRAAAMVDPSTGNIATDSYLAAQGSWPVFQNMIVGGNCIVSNGLHNQLGSGSCAAELISLFEWDANTGIIHTGNGNCVDDFAYGLLNNPIDEWDCDGQANQVWHQINNNKFDGWGNTCLAVNNNVMEMEDCNNFGDSHMSTTFTVYNPPWHYPPLPFHPTYYEPSSIAAYWPAGDLNLVLDVQWNNRTAGTPVWIYYQNGSPAQSWAYSPSTQRISLTDGSNWCLHAQNTNTGGVDIQQCRDGDPQEQWYPTTAMTSSSASWLPGQWVNVASVLSGQACCLEVIGAEKTAESPVGTYPCYGGINQQWNGPHAP
jgi:hypothetical protein